MFMIYTPTEFHISTPNDLLVNAMQLREKENKRTATAILLYHVIDITKIGTVWSV
jgi:hypothetical protein